MRQNRSKRLISARAREKDCETKSFRLLGASPPDPLTRGSAPGPAGGTAPRPSISPQSWQFPQPGVCRIATGRRALVCHVTHVIVTLMTLVERSSKARRIEVIIIMSFVVPRLQ